MVMVYQVHTYAALPRQIHDDLRNQHPEWIQPNGESPMCDSYEARLIELLQSLNQREGANSSGRGHDELEQRQISVKL
jgi:hypothetical protein